MHKLNSVQIASERKLKIKANDGRRQMQDHDCTCYQELTITHLEVSSSDVSELSVPSMSKKKLKLHIKPTLQMF